MAKPVKKFVKGQRVRVGSEKHGKLGRIRCGPYQNTHTDKQNCYTVDFPRHVCINVDAERMTPHPPPQAVDATVQIYVYDNLAVK